MFCKHCGGQVPGDSNFCPLCGKDLADARESVSRSGQTPPPPSRPGRSSLSDRPTAGRETMAATAFAPGDVFGQRFEVRALLGQGGMGAVYRVHDRTLGEECALKVMHPHLLGNARAVERFLQEARLSRRLQHPHIVRVHDIVQFGEWYGLSMELLEGRSLRAWLEELGKARRTVPVETAHRITSQVLEALEYAHGQTIHRDIKPENIFLLSRAPEFTVKLVDFGVAKVLDPEALRSTSSSSGTGCYLAPEQLRPGPEVDARADLFAVGVVLYELLTGRAADGMLVRPSEQRPELGSEWDTLLRSAMDELPGSRPPTATAMREQLQSLKVLTGGEPKRRTELSPPGAGAGRDPEAASRSLDRQVRDADGMREAECSRQEAESRAEEARKQESARLPAADPAQATARPAAATPAGSAARPGRGARGVLVMLGLIVAAIGIPGLIASWPRQQSRSEPEARYLSPEPKEAPSSAPARPRSLPAPGTTTHTRPADGMTEVLIPAGTFLMGSNDGSDDEKPVHRVTLSKSYWMDEHEVSVSQYTNVMQQAPSGQAGGKHPVVNVSWNDAATYCRKVAARLPTEAEWERAARGNKEGKLFPGGDEDVCAGGNCTANGPGPDGYPRTAPFCQFERNDFRLCDMAGNVWEWVRDGYAPDFYQNAPPTDPENRQVTDTRVLRGGSWHSFDFDYLRCAYRGSGNPGGRNVDGGFRCARDSE